MINLTPHPITIKTTTGEYITIPPSGKIARIISSNASSYDVDINGITVSYVHPGDETIVDLPEPQEGVFYIVSSLVLNYLRNSNSNRKDVLSPGTGTKDGVIRDERGNIIAITKLIGIK